MQRSLSLVPVVVWLSSCNFIERYRHELARKPR